MAAYRRHLHRQQGASLSTGGTAGAKTAQPAGADGSWSILIRMHGSNRPQLVCVGRDRPGASAQVTRCCTVPNWDILLYGAIKIAYIRWHLGHRRLRPTDLGSFPQDLSMPSKQCISPRNLVGDRPDRTVHHRDGTTAACPAGDIRSHRRGTLRPILEAYEAGPAPDRRHFHGPGLVNRLESRPTEAEVVITKDAELLDIAAQRGCSM